MTFDRKSHALIIDIRLHRSSQLAHQSLLDALVCLSDMAGQRRPCDLMADEGFE